MTLDFLWSLIRPYRAGMLLVAALLVAESLVALSIPLVGGRLAAQFLASESAAGSVRALLAVMLSLLALVAVLRGIAFWRQNRLAEIILADIRQCIFAQLQALPLLWHQGASRGDLIALVTLETDRLGAFISGTLVRFLPLVLTALGACVMMLRIDPVLALLAPLLVPAFYLLTLVIGRRLRGLGARLRSEQAASVTLVEEMLDLIPVIKAFNAEDVESRRFSAQTASIRDLALREVRIYAVLDPAIQFAVGAAAVILLVLVGQGLRSGDLSAAETVSFLMYVALLVRPVSQLASVYGQVQTARGTLARLQAVLSVVPERLGTPSKPRRSGGDIRFEHVSFSYPDRAAAVRDLTFDVAAGETVALVGANGAGKTTAMALLMGFYRPDSGRVLLDGTDITGIPLSELRARIGYVPQNRHLRNASVRDNIAFGMPDAAMEAVAEAARVAQARDFVEALPQGYDTIIGDRGVKLSGGQQQRIALARALLKDPPILILDEATAMYDTGGEAAFLSECRTALAGRTVFLITHRPASLAIADRVLHMEAGKIVCESAPGGMQP